MINSSLNLMFRYISLAVIATAVNIGVQDLFVCNYNGNFAILASVIVGTVVGLLFKYILDKRYIFRFQARGVAHDAQTFALYALMGLATTLIFWAFEFTFHHIFETKEMRYIGGGIGLAIGYLAKYNLDKHYVFGTEAK